MPWAPNRSERGGENVRARLSELLFVETIRQYLETLPPAETGWLAGLRDPVVGHASAALHAQPKEPWTVEQLARHVGVIEDLERAALHSRDRVTNPLLKSRLGVALVSGS